MQGRATGMQEPAQMMPRVSIVAVTWNRRDCIETLLASLAELDYPCFEVVVVDNASTDGTVDMIRRNFLNVVLIPNSLNLGGSGGFNSGMRHVLKEGKSTYIWLLDNDAEVFPNTLVELVRVLENEPKIGLAGSAIVNPEEPKTFVELGVNINWVGGFVEPFQENQRCADVPEGVYDVDFVPACSALVRCALLDPARLMDERYFLWWDDADFCYSLRAREMRIVCVSRSIVRHPTEKSRPIIDYYNLRNALLFFAKHAPVRQLPIVYAALAGFAVKVIAFNHFNRKGGHGRYLQLALSDFIYGRWGKFDHRLHAESEVGDAVVVPVKRILVTPSSNLENIMLCLACLKRLFPAARIELLIQTYRKNLFSDKGFNAVIIYNDRSRFSLVQRAWCFLCIFFRRYDLAVNSDRDYISPFSFAAKQHASFDATSGKVVRSGGCSDSWRLIAALMVGWLAGPLLFLVLIKRGVRYRYEK